MNAIMAVIRNFHSNHHTGHPVKSQRGICKIPEDSFTYKKPAWSWGISTISRQAISSLFCKQISKTSQSHAPSRKLISHLSQLFLRLLLSHLL